MKIAAVVLTYQQVANDREKLYDQTVEGLREADLIFTVDNGSTDGTRERLAALASAGGLDGVYYNDTGVTTCGHGTHLAMRLAAGTDADIAVLSDDDMCWPEGWRSRLVDWWEHCPDEVWLTGCHLEPEFPWNTIRTTVKHGERGLYRDATGAASWSFRVADWPLLAPIAAALPTSTQGWYDVPFCQAIRQQCGKVAQLDIATHAGVVSTWGNQTVSQYGWDIETARGRLNQ